MSEIDLEKGQKPPRSAHIALIISSSLCAQALARHAQADIADSTSVDHSEHASKWHVLALSGTAAFMTTLDSSIVNIGLPSIARAFDISLSGTIEWVLIGYLVVIAATLLTFGRLSDMLGRKPLFLAGLAVFTLGSALCGAAPSVDALIAARCFQGLGASAIFSVNVALITRAFPPAERGRALGINMILVASGVSAGPTIGGILADALSWRWIFYVNLPIGALAILAARIVLTERHSLEHQRFDFIGALLLAIGIGSLTLGLSFGQEWGWSSTRFLTVMALALASLACVAWRELQVPVPLVSPALLRNRTFVFANASYMICMLALFAVGFLLPFYLEELRGYDTLRSGLLLTPLGLSIACVGLLLLSRLTHASSPDYLVLCLIVTGIGQGIFQPPNARAIMGAAPPDEQGVASGTLATVRVIGQSLSVAVAGAVFTSFGAAAAGTALLVHKSSMSVEHVKVLQQTFEIGLHAAFMVSALLSAAGVVIALARGKDIGASSSSKHDANRR